MSAMSTASNYAPDRGHDGNWARNAPVFAPDFEGEPLPVIWITQRVEEATLERTGRNCYHRYPGALVGCTLEDDELGTPLELEGDEDFDGSLALCYGGSYYEEGMSTQDARFRQDRIDCFRAAELLYLWAAHKGNIQGYANLGYVYSYDRCEGQFFGIDEHGRELGEGDSFPRERRAFECFETAANAGHPEACYKLGDLLDGGRGCKPDPARAIELWKRAYQGAAERRICTWWGAAALRLGRSHEEGRACEQSFPKALEWYQRAATGLRMSVDMGDWFYERSLASAEAGVARCMQELSF